MITTIYDKTMDANRGLVPLAYLRSLAYHESAMNPLAVGPGGELGLFQIANATRETYAKEKHGVSKLPNAWWEDVANSTKAAVWLLGRIATSYTIHHPGVASTDWRSARWVGLLTQGYNVGEGEAKGVGRALTELEKLKTPVEKITYVAAAAINDGLKFNPWMSDPRRLAYVADVVKDYLGAPKKSARQSC